MQPRNSLILPFIALLLPLALYFIVASYVAPVLTSLGISNDILLGVLGFAYLFVVVYSNAEAKSQNKFFKKYQPEMTSVGEEENVDQTDSPESFRRGSAFFLNVVGNLIAITMWIFFFPDQFSESLGVSNIWYQVVVLLALMFLASNCFKIIATSMLAKVNYSTSLNSMKFVIASDIFWYGIVVAYFLLLGGFFV